MERRSPEDRVRAAAMLGEAHQQSGVDAIELIDLQETVVYRALEPKRFGDRSLAWGVAEALGGQRVLTSTSGALGATVLATEPLRRGDRVVGAVSVGLRFDQRLIKTLSTEVGAELALLPRSGKAVVSNVALVERVDALATTEAFLTKIPVYRQGSGDGHTRAYVPMLIVDDAYVMVVEVDSTAAYAALTQSSRRSAVYAAAIMMASIVLGLLTLHYLLAPLRRLRKRAERTAVELTGANIQARQSDEVAAVVEVLDTLTERLVRRNRELADAIVAADAASEAKSRFLSTMSHEIRTPLNGVLGMSELLQYTRLDTEQARYAGAIAAAGRALHDLLGDILDLAKIEEGRIEIDRVDFEPAHRLAEIGALYRELSQARGVALLTEFDPAAAVYVSGDPIRFRAVHAGPDRRP